MKSRNACISLMLVIIFANRRGLEPRRLLLVVLSSHGNVRVVSLPLASSLVLLSRRLARPRSMSMNSLGSGEILPPPAVRRRKKLSTRARARWRARARAHARSSLPPAHSLGLLSLICHLISEHLCFCLFLSVLVLRCVSLSPTLALLSVLSVAGCAAHV